MDWELLGYKEFPFSVNPISTNTIDLFTGHEKQIEICQNLLKDRNIRLVVEGSRGVGTTSFANYLKFNAQKMNRYLSPRDEVSVEKNWNLESLLTAIISTVIREIELSHHQAVKKNKTFLEAKALAYRISEAYNSFGVTAFSFGGNYGKNSTATQPSFIPSTTLGHHLRDLGELAVKLGYRNGLLIQLNNLDINIIHSEEHLEYLFNAARDYFQIPNVSWFLVGDVGLRSFIAKKIDRLDDIISYDVFINPPDKAMFHKLVEKRLNYYQLTKTAKFPITSEVFDYLYDITDGRLRYVFGLIYTLMNKLYIGKLIQNVSLDLAKSTIGELAKERMRKFNLSESEIKIIQELVKLGESSVNDFAIIINKNRTQVSRIINKFLLDKIVMARTEGKRRIYYPSLDAKIAYLRD